MGFHCTRRNEPSRPTANRPRDGATHGESTNAHATCVPNARANSLQAHIRTPQAQTWNGWSSDFSMLSTPAGSAYTPVPICCTGRSRSDTRSGDSTSRTTCPLTQERGASAQWPHRAVTDDATAHNGAAMQTDEAGRSQAWAASARPHREGTSPQPFITRPTQARTKLSAEPHKSWATCTTLPLNTRAHTPARTHARRQARRQVRRQARRQARRHARRQVRP